MAHNAYHHDDVQYEREDLSPGGIIAFLVGLAIVGLLIHVILFGMFRYLDEYAKTHQPPQNPLVKSTNGDTRVAAPQEADKFPLPRLETNERSEFTPQLLKEEEILQSYGWIDQKSGTAHIPVEQAMQLLVQRGLATAPQGGSTAKKQSTRVPSANTAPNSSGGSVKSPAEQQ
jgi:hypothetical protein